MNPNEVTLVFETPEAKRDFMSQLSDGWGEDWVGLNWSDETPFDECQRFNVTVFEDDDFDDDDLEEDFDDELYELGLDIVQDI